MTAGIRMKRRNGGCAVRRQCGAATVEYIVVLAVMVAVLTEGGVFTNLCNAIREMYGAFVYALSMSWIV
ncbi:hypothetical protein [Dyella solisilvae]|uniref:hypothetical protein n=1 Tax=Dyella solisilvae TaxID=1920168 RepID=UPI0011C0363E|nr:hypothetical protein [Dyella solisilvae]